MFKIQKGYDSESKSFRLPIKLIEDLGALAAQNKISLNQLVIQCLNYALENIDGVNKDKPRSE
jgi:predicted HicB family RNase H-like nuclease